jgi:two-component system, OmpR family, response regulator VicR
MDKLILVADDDPDIRQLVRFRLEKEGYQVIEAFNGQQAVDLTVNEDPDMLILDIMMPKMTGFEVVKVVREEENQVPILLLTASVQDAHMSQGFDLGANDYLRKPFEAKELIKRVAISLNESS